MQALQVALREWHTDRREPMEHDMGVVGRRSFRTSWVSGVWLQSLGLAPGVFGFGSSTGQCRGRPDWDRIFAIFVFQPRSQKASCSSYFGVSVEKKLNNMQKCTRRLSRGYKLLGHPKP